MPDDKRLKYATISLPEGLMKRVDEILKEFGYWPSRASFVREACLEKIERLQKREENE